MTTDPTTYVRLAAAALQPAPAMIMIEAKGPVTIDGFGPIPPGAVRVLVSNGKCWRRSRWRELRWRFMAWAKNLRS